VLGLVLGIQVVDIAEELIEAMNRGQKVIAIWKKAPALGHRGYPVHRGPPVQRLSQGTQKTPPMGAGIQY
jgi:hypothetical protein